MNHKNPTIPSNNPARLLPILCLLAYVCTSPQTYAQEADAKLLKMEKFVLSDSAEAAGIDGRIRLLVTVDATGSVKDPRIIGGMIWPCNSDTRDEVKAVESAIKATVLGASFSPAAKDGKPRESDVVLTMAIGKSYRTVLARRAAGQNATSNTSRSKMINAGVINGKALSLPKPTYPMGARGQNASGAVVVQVVIGEDGVVLSAGAVSGHPLLQTAARDAACNAKFSATKLQGFPVEVTGEITCNFIAPRGAY